MSDSYMGYRFELVFRILGEKLTPTQVAAELEQNGQIINDILKREGGYVNHLTGICYQEIDAYRAAGEKWEDVKAPWVSWRPRHAT